MSEKSVRKIAPLIMAGIALFILIIINLPTPIPIAVAGRKPQSQLGTLSGPNAAGTTDAITVAVNYAKRTGLANDPNLMKIAGGNYNALNQPGTSSIRYDNRAVWLVWIKATYQLKNQPFATHQNLEVTDIYVYVDKLTGNPFEFQYAVGAPLPWLQAIAWESVTMQDVGRFPVPVYDPANDPGAWISGPVVNDQTAPELGEGETPQPPATPTLITP